MYLAYTYFIRNKITNQFYYGSRYKNVSLNRSAESDLWIHYFTSSKEVKTLINHYGKDSFEYSIVFQSMDSNECYWKEQRLIEENINNDLCLNEHYTRDGKIKFLRAGAILTENTKNKMSAAKKNIPHATEHNKNVSISLLKKYNTPILERLPKRKRINATDETKTKMSLSNLDRAKKKCPHCEKIADPGNYARYHGIKCKTQS